MTKETCEKCCRIGLEIDFSYIFVIINLITFSSGLKNPLLPTKYRTKKIAYKNKFIGY